MPERRLSHDFLDYSNDPDRDRIQSRALIRKALAEWQGDAVHSIEHAAGRAIDINEQYSIAIDALIRLQAFERQFEALLPTTGVCSAKHSENRMLALAAAIAHAELRWTEPDEFTLAPTLITEALISLLLDVAQNRPNHSTTRGCAS